MAQLAIVAVMAVSALNKGAQARKMKMAESEAIRGAKNRRMAAATREMADEEEMRERIYSRALAISASSGGGVDDPGVVKLMSDLNAEGRYRVLARLWQGQNDAEGLIFKAEAARREGEAALNAGYMSAVTSIFSAYAGGAFGGSTGATVGGSASSAGGPQMSYVPDYQNVGKLWTGE